MQVLLDIYKSFGSYDKQLNSSYNYYVNYVKCSTIWYKSFSENLHKLYHDASHDFNLILSFIYKNNLCPLNAGKPKLLIFLLCIRSLSVRLRSCYTNFCDIVINLLVFFVLSSSFLLHFILFSSCFI